MRRCRQREPAKPAITIERFSNSIFNVKKIFAYSATIICWICRFCRRFFRLFHNYVLLCAAKTSSCNILSFLCTSLFIPIRQYLKPLKGHIKKKKKKNLARLQARFSSSHSSRQLALVAPPPKQRYPKLAQLNLLTDQFIVYLAIVVTYSY